MARSAAKSAAALLLAVLAVLALHLPAAAQKRIALVIGNSGYKHAPELKNPRNDAQDVAVTLKGLGFEVLVGLDLDERGMAQKVREYARALEGADIALFFYAGHGLQAKGANFLVPVDAQLKQESDLDFEAMPLDLVMKQMQRQARVSLVFLDACRDNPLTRSLRAGSRSAGVGQGLARIEDAAGMLIAFSTQPGNVALDGQGRNSPFAKALLAHIGTPGVSVNDIMIDVRRQVMAETADKQVPWENSSLTGRVYFAAPAAGQSGSGTQVASLPPVAGAPGEAARAAPAPDAATLDHTYWTSIAGSNDPALHREYLSRFPNGTYAAIAQARVAAATAPVQMAAATPPGEAGRGLASPTMSTREAAEGLQRELKRVGCYAGGVDGDWGQGSKRALQKFNDETKLGLDTETPSPVSLAKVQGFDKAVCTKPATEPREVRRKSGSGEAASSGSGRGGSSTGDAAASAVIGGVIGGVIGSQVGRRR